MPNEDQGVIYAIIQTPPGSTLERTNEVARALQDVASTVEGVGFRSTRSPATKCSLKAAAPTRARRLINLKDWCARVKAGDRRSLFDGAGGKGLKNIGAHRRVLRASGDSRLRRSGWLFAAHVAIRPTAPDYHAVRPHQRRVHGCAAQAQGVAPGIFTFFAANYPQYELVIDNAAAMQKGVSIGQVFSMENLDILIGSTYEQAPCASGAFQGVHAKRHRSSASA